MNGGCPPVSGDGMLALFVLLPATPTTNLLCRCYLCFIEEEREWLNSLFQSTPLLSDSQNLNPSQSSCRGRAQSSLAHGFPKGNLGRLMA